MNDRQLEWFCRAYEARSFSKAAERAFVSRQALGKAVKSLETELGVALFVRSEFGLAPTSAADLVYPMARRCVESLLEIKEACADFATDTAFAPLAGAGPAMRRAPAPTEIHPRRKRLGRFASWQDDATSSPS